MAGTDLNRRRELKPRRKTREEAKPFRVRRAWGGGQSQCIKQRREGQARSEPPDCALSTEMIIRTLLGPNHHQPLGSVLHTSFYGSSLPLCKEVTIIPHQTDEKTEARREEKPCPTSPSNQVAKWDLHHCLLPECTVEENAPAQAHPQRPLCLLPASPELPDSPRQLPSSDRLLHICSLGC